MAIINQNVTLQSVITINNTTPADLYNIYLQLPTQNYQTGLPNALDNNVIEEIYIHYESEYPTSIYLPLISDLRNAWNPKIYILQNGIGELSSLNVYPQGLDTINGVLVAPFTSYKESKYIHAVSKNMWMCQTTKFFGFIP